MKQRELVSKIMTHHVVTINTTQTLEEAERLFKKHHIRHIPVVSGSKLIGMLSLTDLLRISFVETYTPDQDSLVTGLYNMLSIDQVMVNNPTTVTSSHTIKEVAEILAEREFHALPVVDDDELKGIITTTDLIKYLLDQY